MITDLNIMSISANHYHHFVSVVMCEPEEIYTDANTFKFKRYASDMWTMITKDGEVDMNIESTIQLENKYIKFRQL